MGRTAPMLPFIMLASMVCVFTLLHYDAEVYVSDIVDKTGTIIEPVLQKTTPIPEQATERADSSTVTSTATHTPRITLDSRNTDGVAPTTQADTPKVTQAEINTTVDDSDTNNDLEEFILEDTTIETKLPGVELGGMSVKDLEKKTYDILYLLVGKYPKGETLSSMFTETVVNLTHNRETGRKAIVDSMNRFMSNFPVRAVKLTSVGINGLRLEINTRRIFVHQNGERLDAYGKTTVLLDEKQRITCISDDVQEGEPTTLSPGFKPISYTLKSTITNKTKKKAR